jgi:cell division protease FtsH
MIPESMPLHKITIIPRGVAYLGATMQLPDKDRYMEGRKELQAILAGLMGGRVAEELFCDDVTSGASSDLKEATRIARLMVCSWGMSPVLGPQAFGQNEELMFLGREVNRTQDYSEDTAQRIDAEVHRILAESHDRAHQILSDNRDKLVMIATALLERETVDGYEVEEIVKHGRVLTEAERQVQNEAKAEADAIASPVGPPMRPPAVPPPIPPPVSPPPPPPIPVPPPVPPASAGSP